MKCARPTIVFVTIALVVLLVSQSAVAAIRIVKFNVPSCE